MMEPPNEPPGANFPNNPEEFDADERISFSKLDNKFLLVQSDGSEFEFDDVLKRWIPVLDEALLEQQQRAYKIEGVDENEPANANKRKRKVEYVNGEDNNGRAKPAKTTKLHAPKQNTAVYVTGLPLDVTADEVNEVFSRKCGVIAEQIDSGRPRIKLYTDDEGNFKGDALIVFFKPQSVDMAIMLLDDTDFRIGPAGSSGKMRVQAADSSYKNVQHTNDNQERAKQSNSREKQREKQRIIKKTQKLDAKLADWDDDEPTFRDNSKWEKVVILKHMFTLEELQEDAAALLDIKEDIWDECSKFGQVTKVVLFDLEQDGVVSVRFNDADSALACVNRLNGRNFAGAKVEAYISDGEEHFKKSNNKEDDSQDSKRRSGNGEDLGVSLF